MRLGQGRDNVKELLRTNKELADEIEAKVREHLGFGEGLPASDFTAGEDAYDEY